MAEIKEIFESIQGEGLSVGEKQIFIRFAKCNLNCDYCDTEFNKDVINLNEDEMYEKIKNYDAKTISLTGGEPLLHHEFIKNFLLKYKSKLNKKIHLETNGTLYKELSEIIDLIDIVGMDIKIKSSAKQENKFDINEKFLEISKNKAFAKVVFTKNIADDEIENIIKLVEKYNTPLVLQPKTPIDFETDFIQIYNKFYKNHKNTRLIPQTHTFLRLQ